MTPTSRSLHERRRCQDSLPEMVQIRMQTRHLITAAITALAFLALGACGSGASGSAAATQPDCAGLSTETGGATLLIVTDGQSAALSQVAQLLASDDGAEGLFHSPDLRLDTDPGTVVIAPFTATGSGPVQSFNLAGVGNGARATADARTQRACLAQALKALPPASGGNLLRALGSSVPVAVSRSDGPVAVLALGVSRLEILDFSTTGSDLSTPEARRKVIDTLDDPSFNLVPRLPKRVSGVFFMAPDEGIADLRVEGVRAFVDESLCHAMGVPCSSGALPRSKR